MTEEFNSPTAYPVFYRTYSRQSDTGNGVKRESYQEASDRALQGLLEIGNFTPEESELMQQMQRELKALPSGRWLWVGGTDWVKKPEHYYGGYNCNSTTMDSWEAFALLMNLAMQGCGTGAMLEDRYISQLPVIRNHLEVKIIGEIGTQPVEFRQQVSKTILTESGVRMVVGDSRQGWADSYYFLLLFSSTHLWRTSINGYPLRIVIEIDLSHVRPAGEKLKGFGGISNPVKLPDLYRRVAEVLNGAVGRRLTSVECCLVIDEAALVIVAGNVRRSAGIRQGSSIDGLFAVAKDNLWKQDSEGNWSIDPKRDALRMANHTRIFHHKPSIDECIASVRKQYYSGEGAIQWAGEAIARANCDVLDTQEKKEHFLYLYDSALSVKTADKEFLKHCYLQKYNKALLNAELIHRMQRLGLNPCAEIIGHNFFCNLSEIHTNKLNPYNLQEQADAFQAASLSVVALLHQKFVDERYQKSRELDPIVGVSITGLFDFFVNYFGRPWLEWWAEGRPDSAAGKHFKTTEANYLASWKTIVQNTVWEYCDRNNLKRPNRCTTLQPAGSKSLLTGASPGWHPPKAARYIRRITFRKNDPVALACIDYGYSVTPSQSDKDEFGQLLDDPFDPRCSEWLVEIPIEVSWAHVAEGIDISKFSALAQFDFMMQVQQYYVGHNTSATIELTEAEIEPLGARIHQAIQNDEGYISAALLARFESLETYPRLPFEPISKEVYEQQIDQVHERRVSDNFHALVAKHDQDSTDVFLNSSEGVTGCDSSACLMPEIKPR